MNETTIPAADLWPLILFYGSTMRRREDASQTPPINEAIAWAVTAHQRLTSAGAEEEVAAEELKNPRGTPTMGVEYEHLVSMRIVRLDGTHFHAHEEDRKVWLKHRRSKARRS